MWPDLETCAGDQHIRDSRFSREAKGKVTETRDSEDDDEEDDVAEGTDDEDDDDEEEDDDAKRGRSRPRARPRAPRPSRASPHPDPTSPGADGRDVKRPRPSAPVTSDPVSFGSRKGPKDKYTPLEEQCVCALGSMLECV